MIANINDHIARADALMIEILIIRDAGNGARVQHADTHYVPPNQIPFNSDAFEKRKDVTSVSLSKAQILAIMSKISFRWKLMYLSPDH
jgi:hypothetical protein